MATVKINVTRAEEYRRAMRRLPSELRRELERLFDEAATHGTQTARRLAPVRTGRLRASIIGRRQSILGYTLEASAPYAGYVEFGTRYTRARPFMRPGAEAVRSYLRRAVRGRLADVLRRLKVA